jgi:hypothetical protein
MIFLSRPKVFQSVWAWVAVLVFAGCASAPAPPVVALPRPTTAPLNDNSWWYVRFRMEWPAHADPAWHMDLLIADQVVKPILDRHAPDIALWRFHRRAARDEAGHQFSFIFFAAAGTARSVFSEITAHAVLELARASGRVSAVLCDDPASVSRTAIADTSDPVWSAPLRQAWPYYLMGASQMWLDLVSQLARDEASTGAALSFDQLDGRYASAGEAITTLWQNEGRHAFLHHLNALFGYEPILIIERRHMRF